MTGDDLRTDAGLAAVFEQTVRDWPGVAGTDLFGYRAYEADGTVFAVLDAEGVALTRLPGEAAQRLATDHETGPFEAYGRTIGKWEYVRMGADDLDALVPYVRESYEAAHSGTGSVPPPDDHG